MELLEDIRHSCDFDLKMVATKLAAFVPDEEGLKIDSALLWSRICWKHEHFKRGPVTLQPVPTVDSGDRLKLHGKMLQAVSNRV